MNATIKLHKIVCDTIVDHAKLNANLECGGYLFGNYEEAYDNVIATVLGIYYEKIYGEEAKFVFSPAYLLNVKKYIDLQKHKKVNLIGCYHSHGKYPAIFSDEDRILEKKWGKHKIALIYSPSSNELVGDIIMTDNLALPSRITVFGENSSESKDAKGLVLTKRPSHKSIILN